jgi:hypothetical protein
MLEQNSVMSDISQQLPEDDPAGWKHAADTE